MLRDATLDAPVTKERLLIAARSAGTELLVSAGELRNVPRHQLAYVVEDLERAATGMLQIVEAYRAGQRAATEQKEAAE